MPREETRVTAVAAGLVSPRPGTRWHLKVPGRRVTAPAPGRGRRRIGAVLAAVLVIALMIGAAVTGTGLPKAVAELRDVGAWLSDSALGSVTHVEGTAGRADAMVKLRGTRGDQLRIVQAGATVLVQDTRTGVVYRIDPAQLTVTQTASYGQNGVEVVADSSVAYIVGPAAGLVQRIDPDTLSTVGAPLRLGTRIGGADLAAHGVLWLTLPARGDVMPVRDGVGGAAIAAGQRGDLLGLTVAGDQPIVTDSTAATMMIVGQAGASQTVILPGAVRQSAPPAPLVPAATAGHVVPVVVPRANQLVIVNTGTGRPTAVTLGVAVTDRLQAPQPLGQRIYIPDESTGSLIVYDTATGRLLPPVVVTGRPGPLDVFVNDGMLWANDPNGPAAVAVNATGGVTTIGKYAPHLPGGGVKQGHNGGGATSGAPVSAPGGQPVTAPPGEPTSPPAGPSPSAPSPSVPVSPSPSPSPQPPGAPTATSGPGTIQVTFTPSSGPPPTQYTLTGAPAGATVTPASVPASGAPFTFTVSGLDCTQTYAFAVAAHYASGAVTSPMTTAMRPCVAPSAPQSVKVTATANHSMTIGWAAPASTGGGTVSYTVSWSGPGGASQGDASQGGGSQSGISATSYQVTGLQNSATYSYSVSAVNPAGASQQPASGSQALTPPSGTYNTYRNTALKLNIRAQATQGSSSVAVIPVLTGGGLGPALTVSCQVTGQAVTDPDTSSLTGDIWDKVTYNGVSGYISDLYVDTPESRAQNYDSFSDPPLWECS